MALQSSRTKTVFLTILLAATYIGFSLTPLPGLNVAEYAALGRSPLNLGAFALLVPVCRGIFAPFGSRWSLAVVGVTSLAFSLSLPGFGDSMTHVESLVRQPVWGFRLVAMLSLASSTCVLWFLADQVSATENLSGGICLGVLIAKDFLGMVYETILGGRTVLWVPTSAMLSLLFVPIVLGSVLAIRGVPTAPIAGKARLRSGLDGVGLGFILASLWHFACFPFLGSNLIALIPIVALLSTGALATWLTRAGPRHPPTPLVHLVTPFVALWIGLDVAQSQLMDQLKAEPTAPFQGKKAFVVGVRSSTPSATADAPLILSRLHALGVTPQVQRIKPDQLTLSITNARDSSAIEAALTACSLRIATPTGVLESDGVMVTANQQNRRMVLYFSEQRLEDLCALTTQSLGEELRIEADGTLLRSIQLTEAICDNILYVTLPGTESEAATLRACLESPPLQGTWTLEP